MVREHGLNSSVIFFVIKDHRLGNVAHDGRGQVRVFHITDICDGHLVGDVPRQPCGAPQKRLVEHDNAALWCAARQSLVGYHR